MFGMGTGEMILIAVVVIVLFGAKKLPQLGDGLGKAIRGFQKAMSPEEKPTTKPLDRSEPPPAPPEAK